MTDSSATYRIGIDVGGTFTKAALIESSSRKVIGRYSVHTTHDHERGVAAGVVDVFREVLKQSGVAPEQIVFLAHSTTQATNALLEGDVAAVGLVGMAEADAAAVARDHLALDDVELAPGKHLPVYRRFLPIETLDEAMATETIRTLRDDGAMVLVASAAFGVDDTAAEELVRDVGRRFRMPITCGHEVSRLYGLTTRTRTAIINASILPKMIATASLTDGSVREAGIRAPLMIMRGDGGVMDIAEMHHRPALTLLSGPAASVAGALMHVRMSDGIYFEVGGTSTNIGVIKNGRPAVRFANVGGHDTFISSIDVRVLGVAGGSLARIRDSRIVDVGPRSAHIAGLRYASFAEPSEFGGAEFVLVEPKPGDGREYAAVRGRSGELYALTPTCAANALGATTPEMHCHAGPHAARLAFTALARHLGTDIDAAATQLLDQAVQKIRPTVEALVREYRLDSDQRTLIGEGGGVGALIGHIAAAMALRFEIAEDAEIISSIGAALAMVRDVVERVIPNPSPADLVAIRKEARDAAVRLGADPRNVEISVEIDKVSGRVRAVAIGSAELRSDAEDAALPDDEIKRIAASSMGLDSSQLLQIGTGIAGLRIYTRAGAFPAPFRVLDRSGTIRLQSSGAIPVESSAARPGAALRQAQALATGGAEDRPFAGAFLLHDGHVLDLTGLTKLDQAIALAEAEMASRAGSGGLLVLALASETVPAASDHEP